MAFYYMTPEDNKAFVRPYIDEAIVERYLAHTRVASKLLLILSLSFSVIDLLLGIMLRFGLVWWISSASFGLALLPFVGMWIYQLRKRRKLRIVLEQGQICKATVSGNRTNWGTRFNGAPQRIVSMTVNGKTLNLKMFDHRLADELPAGLTVEILYDDRYPDTIIPTRLLV